MGKREETLESQTIKRRDFGPARTYNQNRPSWVSPTPNIMGLSSKYA